MRRLLLALSVVWALLALSTHAGEPTFTGYGYLDHREFIGTNTGQVATPRSFGIDGTTLEVAEKVVVDVTQGVNVNMKMCFGCHGIELAQGYGEWQANDKVNIRLGRFNVPVGEFNTRSDPTNYTTPSKPLPYAMGDMLFYLPAGFNLGVVPTPYVDNGIEVFGSLASSKDLQFDYSVYAVKGFSGTNDLDFVQSRNYIDNNHTPAVGTRLVLSSGDFSVGASAGGGFYDPKDSLRYGYAGAELYWRVSSLVFRGEVIDRLTEFDPTVPGYRFAITDHYFSKLGWYAQADWNATEWLSLMYRSDGLHRMGMPLPGSDISSPQAGIFRQTVAFLARRKQFAVKGGYEYWHVYGAPYASQHVIRVGLMFSY